MTVRLLVGEVSVQDILTQRNDALSQEEEVGECTLVARSPYFFRRLTLRSHLRIVCRRYRFLSAVTSGFV